MSGDNETQPNFDKFFDKLLNTEYDIGSLIKTIPYTQDFITALDNYVIEKQSNDKDVLTDEQSQRLATFLDILKEAELDEFDDPNGLTTAGSFFPEDLGSLDDDDTFTGKLKEPAELSNSTNNNIPSKPNPVNIELTPETIITIKEEIQKTLGKAKELITNRDQEILDKLTEISASIQSEDPKKSLATLATFLSTQQIPKLRQLGNSLSEKWFYILPPCTEKIGSSPEAQGINLVQNGYHQLLHVGNQLLIELYSTKNIEEFIEKCKKMPLYQELLVNNSDYQDIYKQRNKGKIPKVSDPPKNEQQNLLTAIDCVMWSINHISNLQGATMERGSFKIIDPDNRLYDMLTSYTKLVNNGKLPNQTSFMRNKFSYVRQNTGIIGKRLSTHDFMCEILYKLFGLDFRFEKDTNLVPVLPEARQHAITGASDIEGEYPTTTIKWETAGINPSDTLDHLRNLREMQKLQKEGKLGKATTSGRSYRENQFTPKINEVFIKFLQKSKTQEPFFVKIITLSSKIEQFQLLQKVGLREKEDIEELEKNNKQLLETEFKKLSIHQIYDFMDKQIESSPIPLQEELINIKKELQKVADENQLDHPKIRAGSELILDFSKFCLLKNDLQDLLTINKNPLLNITGTIDSPKESAEELSALYAKLSKELSSTSIKEENSNNLKEILREIFILENPDNYSITPDTPHLHIAAQLRKINTHVAEKLLERFPEMLIYNETTPLLLAADAGNNNMVQALLENSTIRDKLIDETCPPGTLSPLDISLDNGHSYIIATLLQRGAKIGDLSNYKSDQKKRLLSELHKAERSQDDSIMERIRAKNPNIQGIITQLEQEQQTILKTSIESSVQSPRRRLPNIAQSFGFGSKDSSNPQSPSSSSRNGAGWRLSKKNHPERNDSGSVQSPSRTSRNSDLPDSKQPLGSDSPAASPKHSKLDRFAFAKGMFKQKDIDSPREASSPQSLRSTNDVKEFDSILDGAFKQKDSSSPRGASSPQPLRSTNYIKEFDDINEILKSGSSDEQPPEQPSKTTNSHKKHR